MSGDYTYQFTAVLSKLDYGRMAYDVVYLPDDLVDRLEFPTGKRLRIDGEICGVRFGPAILPSGGRFYIIVSGKLQRECLIHPGDDVDVCFDIADPNRVDIPTELEHAIAANDPASVKWNNLSAGKKRGMCYRVSSAKRIETKERRIEEIIAELIEES